MSGAVSTPLGLAIAGSGIVLMFSAYRGLSPISLVTGTLQGAAPGSAAPLAGSGARKGGTASPTSPTSPTSPGTALSAAAIDHNNSAAMTAWIKAHLGTWPDPGRGANDFWNAIAKSAADTAHVKMIGQP